ncbi:zinc finger MYND domain-containing protein [Phanerochaete sordida]|uniref:Zinc finger MYND domain-containing protein n=1 Tax=Phanerochaete sordida TaxID=48140 RepID=A0A9P3GEV2_9APHY|nr:zinc finger MYND domain-containing protein [Phanerochaete sordida]
MKELEDGAPRVTLDTFASPEGVRTPDDQPLSRKDLEDVYWRCKTFDSGYVLAYVAQQVFDALPPTATLSIRTSQGYDVTCAPKDTTVAEIAVLAREPCMHVVLDGEQNLSGFDGPLPWIWLFLGAPESEKPDIDTRAVLDLGLAQLGGHGSGGEHFALERGVHYLDVVLNRFAVDLGGDLKLSHKITLSPPVVRAHGDAVKAMVLQRLAKVAGGNDQFCRHCGKDEITLLCSRCKKAYFCKECLNQGWKYHKRWCHPPPTNAMEGGREKEEGNLEVTEGTSVA